MKNLYLSLITLVICLCALQTGYSLRLPSSPNTDKNSVCDTDNELVDLTFSMAENIVINELNYRSPKIQEDIDFIELYNAGTVAVDLTGWKITDGVSYQFPAGTIINAGAYLVIAADPSTCESVFNFSNALGPYSAKLNSERENVKLRNQADIKVDEVAYRSWQEWPAVRYINDGASPASIQKINPDLPGKYGGSWRAGVPTPKAANTSVFIPNSNNIPVVKSVSKTPDKPNSGEIVRIKADLTNIDGLTGVLSVSLEYQVVSPGNYIHKSDAAYANNWTTIQMLDNGVGADSTANNGVYTVAIPATVQVHRRLIRYRVKISTSTGYLNTYPDQNHIESNYSYYVYDSYPLVGNYNINTLTPMQEITVITGNETADEYIGPGTGTSNSGQYSGDNYRGEGTLVYNGKVYDHIRFRPRGRPNGRADRYKPGIKFDMNKAHTFAPLKDCGEEYEEERGKLTLSGTYVNDIASHGFTESLIHKILKLMGTMGRGTEYTQLRIVDENAEVKDFWGVFLIMEGYDQEYLKENNYPVGNIWRHKSGRLSSQGDFPNSDNIGDWDKDMGKADWDLLLADKAANMFFANGADNYEGKHSQRDYYNSETGKWHIWYGDYDTAFGMSSDNPSFHKRSNSSVSKSVDKVQSISSRSTEFKNVMRSAYDLLFNAQQINYLIDVETAPIYNPNAAYDWTTLDKFRWNQEYDLGTVDRHFNWYRTWFQNRSNFLLNSTNDGFRSSDIPNKPVINLTGTRALDNMTFSNSAFSDPQGANTFTALEWRVGEWSDPSNPVYQNTCDPKYEIESVWESGETSSFSNNFTIPSSAKLAVGKTYKIRVRYKDNSGNWSHWSDAVQIVPTPASDNNVPALVINEIMYRPLENSDYEFIELKNTGTSTIDLDGLAFTDGIDYNFPTGRTIQPGGFIVLAKDSLNFIQKYGFRPFGDYSGSLNNDGERLELRGLYNKVIDSLTYSNKDPWDEGVDSTGFSLELLHATLDNTQALNWFRSDNIGGTPNVENSRTCAQSGAGIVINEINYSSNKDQLDAGDWVELHNPTATPIDLSGWTLYDSGDEFVLPQGTILGAEGYAVLVEDENDFTSAYPTVNSSKIIGAFPYKLSGKGERITLFDKNKCLADYVIYNDKSPWPTAPDGDGPTLSLLDPSMDNALPQSWESSLEMNASFVNGSPAISNICVPGQSCDDGNECTSNDIFDADCNCVGTLETTDSDGDGVCDLADICAGFNDNLIGTPCDDGNECTVGERYDTDCGCSGGIEGDIDNDGLCDVLDECDNNLTGTSCDDGDPCTTGETYDSNCNCTGGVLADSDNDGVCDEEDVCDGFDDNLLGQICDDGNPLTEFDMYNADACGCAGIIVDATICNKITNGNDDAEESSFGNIDLSSSDLDMIEGNIVGLRFQNIAIPNGATITNATIQFGSDETDSGTSTITIKAAATDNAAPFTSTSRSLSSQPKTAATVTWEPAPWTSTGIQGAAQKTIDLAPIIQELINRPGFVSGNAIAILIESTGNRVAETHDTSPALAAELCIAYATDVCQIGYPCDDGNALTGNDVLQADCSCAGTIMDADGDGFTANEDCNDNDPNLTIIGASCNDGDATTENDVVLANCSCAGTPIDADNDGFSINEDCNDNDANLTVVGASCNDGDATTENDVVLANCSCAGTPIDADNDGFSINEDCNDNDANLTIVGASCNDGDATTENDIVLANCSCAGTLIGPDDGEIITTSCDGNTTIVYGNGQITMSGQTGQDYFYQILNKNWEEVYSCNWQCGSSQTISNLPAGVYLVYIKNNNFQVICTKEVMVSAFNGNTDNDNDGVPASQDCDDNDANITIIGATCNDGNVATENDVVQANCTCAGTPTNTGGETSTISCDGNTSITYGNGTIKMDGLAGQEYFFQVLNAAWQEEFNCGWQCGISQTVTGLAAGDYRVYIKNSNYQIICEQVISVSADNGSGGGNDPDNDNDGVPASQDCNDNDANVTIIGATCNDGNATTENDVVQANCTCAGTPTNTGGTTTTLSCGGNTSITYGNGSIQMNGLGIEEYFFQVLNADWQEEYNCSWNCGSSQTVTGLAAGDYRVYIKNSNYQIICEQVISVSADNSNGGGGDPDNDKDGVPASQDCNDNDANLTTIGATCTDGDATTENDIVQANCTCAGTPTNTGGGNGTSLSCGETSITYGDGTIQIVGQANTDYYFKINDLNAGWAQVAGCGWNCGSEYTATDLANSTYLVTVYQDDWMVLCSTEITMTGSSFRPNAGSRNAPQLAFSAYGSQRQVALEWATNTGWKNSHFEIERSLDGLTFETIGEQLNEAMADDMKQYKQADISPLAGTNYYRIKQVYLDGSFDYTNPQQIDFSVLPDFGIYPNPANEATFLNLKEYQGKAVDLVIYNQFGQAVFEQAIDKVDGAEVRLDTRNYDNGLYIVKIETANRKSISKKLVISRLY